MNKISNIKRNILYFLDFKGITKKEFCEKTGISYANMRGKSLESEIGGGQIAEILNIYSEINPEWLLTGKGNMLRSSESKKVESSSEDVLKDKIISLLEAENERLKDELSKIKSDQATTAGSRKTVY